MKNTVKTLLLAITIIAGCTFMSCASTKTEPETKDNVIIGMANPFVDFATLEEAQEFAGFNLALPAALPDWVTKTIYRGSTVNMKLIEIIYAQDENLTKEIRVRKGTENKNDISGDYNTYEKESDLEIAGHTVHARFNGEKIYLVTWEEGDFSYSVSFSDGASEDFVKEFVAGIE